MPACEPRLPSAVQQRHRPLQGAPHAVPCLPAPPPHHRHHRHPPTCNTMPAPCPGCQHSPNAAGCSPARGHTRCLPTGLFARGWCTLAGAHLLRASTPTPPAQPDWCCAHAVPCPHHTLPSPHCRAACASAAASRCLSSNSWDSSRRVLGPGPLLSPASAAPRLHAGSTQAGAYSNSQRTQAPPLSAAAGQPNPSPQPPARCLPADVQERAHHPAHGGGQGRLGL